MPDKLHSANQYESLEGQLCDTVITASGVQFEVNKIVLCKCSMYFRTLFTRNPAHDRRVFEIQGMSAEAMQLIIKFAYTGSVYVTEDNVQELFEAADQLMVTGIQQVCCNFIVERLGSENCIGIWQFTYFCFSPELQQKAYNYILRNFEEVVSSEEFLHLSVQELTDILVRDELCVTEEKALYEAVIKWMAHAPTERNRHFPALLSKVRLALTDADYIRAVMHSEDVQNNAECIELVRHAMLFKDHMALSHSSMSMCSNLVARPRLPNVILFAIGGSNDHEHQTEVTEVYDICANCWNNVADHQMYGLSNHGTAYYNGSVYCVGGSFKNTANTMYRFDLMTCTWHEAAPMHCNRSHLSVTELNGYIYAIGGSTEASQGRTAERYKPETNQWSWIASMHELRMDASCASFNHRIYVCGGCNDNIRLDTCEYYSPENDQWTVFANMISRRCGHSVIAYVNQIFAVGGFDGSLILKSVEAYNPQTHTWRAVSPMSTCRTTFGIAVIANKLFVFGGFRNFTFMNTVEYYDANTDQWCAASSMNIVRCGVSCCAVSELPNVAEYVISRDTLPQLYLEEGTIEAFNSK